METGDRGGVGDAQVNGFLLPVSYFHMDTINFLCIIYTLGKNDLLGCNGILTSLLLETEWESGESEERKRCE